MASLDDAKLGLPHPELVEGCTPALQPSPRRPLAGASAPPGQRDEAAADERGGADDEIDHRLVGIAAGDRLRGTISERVRRAQAEDEQNDADNGDDHAKN